MSHLIAYCVFDVLTDFVMSRNFDLLRSSKHRPIIYHIKEHILRPAVCVYAPLLAVLKVDKLLFKNATQSTKEFWKWVKSAITNRIQHGEGLQDMFTRIQRSRQSEGSPALGIQSETGMFLVAGLDTTTTALCSLLFYLSRNQSVYERLCSEVRETFESKDQIRSGEQLRSCVFLQACIDEALRMSPPAASPPWREVGVGGEVIAGQVIPQGCHVGTGTYSLHHHEAHFLNPHVYNPDRWFSGPPMSSCRIQTPAFIPFSIGSRSCIGRTLAYSEISLIVVYLLWKYDFRASSGRDRNLGGGEEMEGMERVGRANPGEFQVIDRVVGLQDGPVLEFRVRNITRE